MDVQLYGLPKSKTTRKAQRFFSERRVAVGFHDLRKRGPTPGELRKWVQRFGVEAVLDPQSKTYQEQGLQFVGAGEDIWLERMARDPGIIALRWCARAGSWPSVTIPERGSGSSMQAGAARDGGGGADGAGELRRRAAPAGPGS